MTVYIACCPFCKKHKLRTISKTHGFAVGCKDCTATGPVRGTMPAAIHAWNNAFKSIVSCSPTEIKFQAYLLNYPSALTIVDSYQTVRGIDQFEAIEEELEYMHREFSKIKRQDFADV